MFDFKKKNSVTPTTTSSTPNIQTNNLNIPKIPQINSGVVNNNSNMNYNLNHEELLAQRHKIPFYILILKYLSLLLITVSGFAYLALTTDSNAENKYLSKLGIENTGKKAQTLIKKQKKLTEKISKSSSQIAKLKYNIETENWAAEKPFIDQIIDEQFTWFTKDNTLGLIDSIDLMKKYFNKNTNLTQGILKIVTSSTNSISINNLNISRTNISFTVNAKQMFKRTFYLGTEFVKIANSFPTFKNGKINNFTKKENNDG